MINIRTITTADIEAILSTGSNEERFATNNESSGFWTREQLYNWISSGNDVLLAAEHEGRIIGYALSQTHQPTGKSTIENLYVAEDYRGQGLGRKLIVETVKQLRERGSNYQCAMVELNNISTIKTLESAGIQQGKRYIWMDKK